MKKAPLIKVSLYYPLGPSYINLVYNIIRITYILYSKKPSRTFYSVFHILLLANFLKLIK
ncbi:hypothetical protein CN679_08505 [Bacillus pseudomycoides]|nr:hypothetical protein CN679_08505 [Bacillus pseudomycoides]